MISKFFNDEECRTNCSWEERRGQWVCGCLHVDMRASEWEKERGAAGSNGPLWSKERQTGWIGLTSSDKNSCVCVCVCACVCVCVYVCVCVVLCDETGENALGVI